MDRITGHLVVGGGERVGGAHVLKNVEHLVDRHRSLSGQFVRVDLDAVASYDSARLPVDHSNSIVATEAEGARPRHGELVGVTACRLPPPPLGRDRGLEFIVAAAARAGEHVQCEDGPSVPHRTRPS
jgi:hypothetical protein